MILGIILQDVAPAASAKGGMFGGDGLSMILMLGAVFAIMYFLMIRPQQKKQKAIEKARAELKPGDRVISAGGIHGKIREVKDTTFLVEVADGVKLKFEKTSVHPAGAAPEETLDATSTSAK